MNNSNLFILAGNAGYYNRGSEAIIRGTTHILRHYFENPRFLAISHYKNNLQYEQQCMNESDTSITHKKMHIPYKRFDHLWFTSQIMKRVFPRALKKITYKEVMRSLGQASAVLAVGGDNYSLDYGEAPATCTDLDDLVVAAGKPLVIWAASVGPFSKNPEYEKYMAKHLQKVYILAREPWTVQYLAGLGLVNNVYRVADPAFVMESQKPKDESLTEIDDNAIGLNLSPLMSRFVTDGDRDQWLEISRDIVLGVSNETGRRVYLIPHVTGNYTGDDHTFLKEVLLRTGQAEGRITILPPVLNAAETKWVISKLCVFAGARTHSTIAAMSSGVPTLSFAYSMKARGINQDVYGHTNYCISPDQLTPALVVGKIQELLLRSEEIRSNLGKRIPEVQKMSMDSGKILKKILMETYSYNI